MRLRKTAAVVVAAACLLAAALEARQDATTGPLSRKVTKEDKQAIDAFLKAASAAWRKGDINAVAAFYDFPIYMGTDNAKGVFSGGEWSREQFVSIMGGMMKTDPKDVTHNDKYTPHFLSDSLAVVIIDTTATQGGKNLGSYKSAVTVIKKDGQWRFKSGLEAGHGQ
jgi:uncharacterized protein (TIGR02246 family)